MKQIWHDLKLNLGSIIIHSKLQHLMHIYELCSSRHFFDSYPKLDWKRSYFQFCTFAISIELSYLSTLLFKHEKWENSNKKQPFSFKDTYISLKTLMSLKPLKSNFFSRLSTWEEGRHKSSIFKIDCNQVLKCTLDRQKPFTTYRHVPHNYFYARRF